MEGLQDGLKDGSVEVASAAKSFVKTPCEPGMTAHTAIPVLKKIRIVLSSTVIPYTWNIPGQAGLCERIDLKVQTNQQKDIL